MRTARRQRSSGNWGGACLEINFVTKDGERAQPNRQQRVELALLSFSSCPQRLCLRWLAWMVGGSSNFCSLSNQMGWEGERGALKFTWVCKWSNERAFNDLQQGIRTRAIKCSYVMTLFIMISQCKVSWFPPTHKRAWLHGSELILQ